MAKVKKDAFVNTIVAAVTCSAANTLTFAQINMGVGLFQGVALIIHRVMYTMAAGDLLEIAAGGDELFCGITVSNQLADINVDQGDLLDRIEWRPYVLGAANAAIPFEVPVIHDFNALPGGGIIVPANPLFLALDSAGFVAAAHMDVKIFFTFKELSDSDYLELMQARMRANI